MDKPEVRHTKAIAYKIRNIAEQLMNNMDSVWQEDDRTLGQHSVNPVGDGTLISGVKARFTHDSGYGVLDYTDKIQAVLTDMLPLLDEMEKERLEHEQSLKTDGSLFDER